ALSVALLCNVTTANPGGLGGRVADVFLPGATAEASGGATAGGGASTDRSDRSATPELSSAALATYEGTYHSRDAETTLTVALEDGALVAHRRPATRIELTPGDAPDTFRSSLGGIRFIREGNGPVNEFSLSQARVYDLRFHRVPGDGAAAPQD
ncbi:MAG: hypothetical protein WDZ89_02435, partial [Gemmatimonadota bacterium]